MVEALYWYTNSANTGDLGAQHNLGLIYVYGIGTQKDVDKSIEWFKKAAEQGWLGSQISLGDIYVQESKYQNFKEAEKWYRKAAQQNDAYSANKLGWIYESGKGVNKNIQTAFNYYLQAAKLNFVKAQMKVADMYEHGVGVNQNMEIAIRFYNKAAQNGNTLANCVLGEIYLFGRNTVKNLELAKQYLEIASSKGNANAMLNLGNIYFDEEEATQEEAKGQSGCIKLYEGAAAQGLVEGNMMLGLYYKIRKNNPTKAFEYFEKAAQKGFPDALFHMGLLCENGLVGLSKIDNAIEYYRCAMELGHTEASERFKMYSNKNQTSRVAYSHGGLFAKSGSIDKLFSKAEYFAKTKNYEKTFSICNQILSKNPKLRKALLLLAKTQKEAGLVSNDKSLLNDAIKNFERAKELMPSIEIESELKSMRSSFT